MKTKKNLRILTANLLELERQGEYALALSELREIWQDTSLPPDIDGLNELDAAELLLRCGSLIGFQGHLKHISGSQETSKNLLTEAIERFSIFGVEEKIAECEGYLALAYWRTGELVEAESWIEQSLSRNLKLSNPTRIHSQLIKSMLLIRSGKFKDLLSYLQKNKSLVLEFGDSFLIGTFWNNIGIAFRNLGELDQAIESYRKAKIHFNAAGHYLYLGLIENNLALCYRSESRFPLAHHSADNAIKIYEKLGDATRKGSSLDTKAQIFIAERDYEKALRAADEAVEVLRGSENSAYLTEAFLTKSKALLYLDDISSSVISLFQAMEIARINVGEKAVVNLAREFEATARKKFDPFPFDNKVSDSFVDEELELTIPPSLAHYDDYQVIRIRNSHLENIGIPKNSLVLVVDEDVKRGDLVAIKDLADESIICGVYDCFAGIISISGHGSETLLFKNEESQVIGRLVGIGKDDKDPQGKLRIKPLGI